MTETPGPGNEPGKQPEEQGPDPEENQLDPHGPLEPGPQGGTGEEAAEQEGGDSLEATEEPLEASTEEQDPWEAQAVPGEEPKTKRCLFCGAELPLPARACQSCGHALGLFEPSTPKEYFRWFFCGLLIVVGCFMPCGPHGHWTLGTLLGGLYFIMGLGVMWNMWAAIHSGRFKMFWLTMLIIPAILGTWRFVFALIGDPGWASVWAALTAQPTDWGTLRNFLWEVGYGPFFITIGSVLAWILLIAGFLGAIRHSKQKAAERASAGGGRYRRR